MIFEEYKYWVFDCWSVFEYMKNMIHFMNIVICEEFPVLVLLFTQIKTETL